MEMKFQNYVFALSSTFGIVFFLLDFFIVVKYIHHKIYHFYDFKCMFNGIKCIYVNVQTSHDLFPELFSTSTETLYLFLPFSAQCSFQVIILKINKINWYKDHIIK